MAELSETELEQLGKAFGAMGVKPKGDTPEELEAWMLDYLNTKGKIPKVPDLAQNKPPVTQVTVSSRVPNICPFSGNPTAKSESFELWKYEVECLVDSSQYNVQVIEESVRRSLKGEAARVVKRLGVGTRINVIIAKLNTLFGNVALSEDVLAQFYNAQQRPDEDVSLWSCRLEDLLDQATVLKRIPPNEKVERLRTKLYSGLRDSLKSRTHHLFLSLTDYDELRIHLRRVEYDMKRQPEVEDPDISDKTAVIQSHVKTNIDNSSQRKVHTNELQDTVSKLTQENANLKRELEDMKNSQTQDVSQAHIGRGKPQDLSRGPYQNNPCNAPFFPNVSSTDYRSAPPVRQSSFNRTTTPQSAPWYPPPQFQQPRWQLPNVYRPPPPTYQARHRLPREQRQCWACGQLGHIQHECTTRLNRSVNY